MASSSAVQQDVRRLRSRALAIAALAGAIISLYPALYFAWEARLSSSQPVPTVTFYGIEIVGILVAVLGTYFVRLGLSRRSNLAR